MYTPRTPLPWLSAALLMSAACQSSLDRAAVEPGVTDDDVAVREPMKIEPYPDISPEAAAALGPEDALEPSEEVPLQRASAIEDPDLVGMVFVELDPAITAACDELRDARTFFEFDSAALLPEARAQLEALADCMTTGGLAGTAIEIVGTADPRGEFDYNYELGMARADAVAHFLEDAGIDANRLQSLSVGETFASPSDIHSYAFERRVVVQIDQDPETSL